MAKRAALPVENIHGNSHTHMVKIPDHAALRNGASSGFLLMRAVAASSDASPQIRDISTLTSAPKPVRILRMNNMTPKLKIQVSKNPLAETMTTPPDGR
jgi:hypothetical protein